MQGYSLGKDLFKMLYTTCIKLNMTSSMNNHMDTLSIDSICVWNRKDVWCLKEKSIQSDNGLIYLNVNYIFLEGFLYVR